MKTVDLAEGERIVAVVPEVCTGPGWHNAIVWVYIGDRNGSFRCESIQQTDGVVVCRALIAAVPTPRAPS